MAVHVQPHHQARAEATRRTCLTRRSGPNCPTPTNRIKKPADTARTGNPMNRPFRLPACGHRPGRDRRPSERDLRARMDVHGHRAGPDEFLEVMANELGKPLASRVSGGCRPTRGCWHSASSAERCDRSRRRPEIKSFLGEARSGRYRKCSPAPYTVAAAVAGRPSAQPTHPLIPVRQRNAEGRWGIRHHQQFLAGVGEERVELLQHRPKIHHAGVPGEHARGLPQDCVLGPPQDPFAHPAGVRPSGRAGIAIPPRRACCPIAS